MNASAMSTDAAPDGAIIAAWNVGAIHRLWTPPTGTINRTVMVSSDRGTFALRAYRHRERRRVQHEHSIIAYARAQGIPAIAPLPLPTGDTILAHAGRFYALFPAAPGQQVQRTALTQAHVAAMGRFLAQLQHALHAFPATQAFQRSFRFDRATALRQIERLVACITERATLAQLDQAALLALQGRQRWIMEQAPPTVPDLGALEHQVIHGDYQETNLFWQGATISAIIDWDQAYPAPRAWEVARTLHLVFNFEPAASRRFLDGYRAVQPLGWDELEQAASAYALMRAYDVWVYEAYYLENNHRVAQYITPAPFEPLTDTWAQLRATLPKPMQR